MIRGTAHVREKNYNKQKLYDYRDIEDEVL